MRPYFILTAVVLAFAAICHAGDGVRGGETVDVNGTKMVRDVIEQATCDWKRGQEMMDKTPEVTKIINSIRKLDWYLALDVEKEMRSLNFCLTGPLRPIETNMDNMLHVPSYYPSLFTGLRYGNQVHVNQKLLASLSNEMQGLFLIHETFHSYLATDGDPAERRINLMSMVKTIYKVYHKQITTREELHYEMQQNQFLFPTTVSELDGYRTQLEFILSDSVQQKKIFLSTLMPEKLVKNHYYKMAPYVASWDGEAVQQSPSAILTAAIENVLKTGKPSEIDYVLNTQMYKKVNPQFIAFGDYADLTPTQQARLSSQLNNASAVNAVLSDFKNVTVTVLKDRIVASAKLQGLAGHRESVVSIPVMELSSLSPKSETPVEIKILSSAVVLLAQGNESVLKTLITENPEFYSALRLDSTLSQIAALESPIPREKGYAQDSVKTLSASLVERFKQTLESNLDDDDFEKLSSMIHWDQFNSEGK